MPQALRYLLADEAASSKGVEAFARQVDEATEQKLALVLVHAVSSELDSFASSLEEDLALLSSSIKLGDSGSKGFAETAASKLGLREQIALQFRIEKKKVLQACLAQMKG